MFYYIDGSVSVNGHFVSIEIHRGIATTRMQERTWRQGDTGMG